MAKVRMKKHTETTATVILTLHQVVTLNVNELVKVYGQVARTKAFLEDYAAGNRGCKETDECHSGGAIIMDYATSFEHETKEVPYYG
jgi:hypothetical protein